MQNEAPSMDELKKQAPTVGKIYAPKDAPDEHLYVESVDFIDADEDGDACFFVEACAPEDVGSMDSMGYELHSDEWIEHGYTLIR